MEYVQMTLNDWMEMKQKLKMELLGVKQSFVRIGYTLRKIEDQKLYEQDGYKSIAEFAQKEYGLEPSTTSRFMSINREYSVDGYSEHLRPEYADLGRSQLEEMLKLPDNDRQMIKPETPREDIRELKRFNKTEPAAGIADGLHQLVENFYKDNPEIRDAVCSEDLGNTKRLAEIINPGGNRSYRKGLYFMMMYEDRIAVKKFGGSPQSMTWEEFISISKDIFEEAAEEPAPQQRCFEEEDEEKPEDSKPEQDGEPEKENTVKDDEPETAGGENSAEEESGELEEECIETRESSEKSKEDDSEETRKEEIAPAQKTLKNLNREADHGGQNEEDYGTEEAEKSSEPETEGEEVETEEMEEAESEIVDGPEMIKKPYGSRKDYMNALTPYGMAMYMAEEYIRHNLKESILSLPSELEKWLLQEVDENGREIECL